MVAEVEYITETPVCLISANIDSPVPETYWPWPQSYISVPCFFEF